jgi:hypothetical protein
VFRHRFLKKSISQEKWDLLRRAYCLALTVVNIWNGRLLDRFFFGVVTVTGPVVASSGTVAVTYVSETTVNLAATPLKETLCISRTGAALWSRPIFSFDGEQPTPLPPLFIAKSFKSVT